MSPENQIHQRSEEGSPLNEFIAKLEEPWKETDHKRRITLISQSAILLGSHDHLDPFFRDNHLFLRLTDFLTNHIEEMGELLDGQDQESIDVGINGLFAVPNFCHIQHEKDIYRRSTKIMDERIFKMIDDGGLKTPNANKLLNYLLTRNSHPLDTWTYDISPELLARQILLLQNRESDVIQLLSPFNLYDGWHHIEKDFYINILRILKVPKRTIKAMQKSWDLVYDGIDCIDGAYAPNTYAVLMLERDRPGITARLYKKFGIAHQFCYPPEILIQLDSLTKPAPHTILSLATQYDHSAEKLLSANPFWSDLQQDLKDLDQPTNDCVIEFDGLSDLIEKLTRNQKLLTQVDTILFMMHLSPEGIMIGWSFDQEIPEPILISKVDFNQKILPKLASLLKPGGKIKFTTCGRQEDLQTLIKGHELICEFPGLKRATRTGATVKYNPDTNIVDVVVEHEEVTLDD